MAGGLQQSQSQSSQQQQSTSGEGREGGKSAKTRVFSFINHHLSLFRFRGSAHAVDARTLAVHVFAGDSRRSIFTLFLFLGVTGSVVVAVVSFVR